MSAKRITGAVEEPVSEKGIDAKDPPWYVQEFRAQNERTWDKYVKTPSIVPSLNHRPGKKKAMYRQRREACAAVGRANGNFCNLETFQIGYPCTKVPGGTRYRTQKERAASQGVGVRRFRRAEKDMRDGNLYPCYKRVTVTKEDGVKRGRAWARTISANLYKAAGTWKEIKRLKRACCKENQEKREKPDEAGKARVDLATAGMLRPKRKRARIVTSQGPRPYKDGKAEADRLRAHFGIGAPPKPT